MSSPTFNRRVTIAVLLAAFSLQIDLKLGHCTTNTWQFTGGRGKNDSDAVVILGAADVVSVALAESEWLKTRYGNFVWQALSTSPGPSENSFIDSVRIVAPQKHSERLVFRYKLNPRGMSRDNWVLSQWMVFMDQITKASANPAITMRLAYLEAFLTDGGGRAVGDYMMDMLIDKRKTLIVYRAPGSQKGYTLRVCDLAAGWLIRVVRLRRNHERIFPRKLLTDLYSDRRDSVVDLVAKWCESDGRRLLHNEELEFERVFLK